MAQEFKNNVVVYKGAYYTFHKFHEEDATGIPIFVVVPHAGRHGNVGQSIIDECAKTGRPVYTFELHSATQSTKDLDIEGLVDILDDCVADIGFHVDLVGLCQGGWLSCLFAALYPSMVNKLALFVAPINTKCAPDNVIEQYMSQPYVMEYHKYLFNMCGGIQPGIMQWFAFSMVDPSETYMFRFMRWANAMLNMSDNGKSYAKEKRNNEWHDEPQNLGKWFIEVMENHFHQNKLYNGEWVVHRQKVRLENITAETYLYAGETDNITATAQVFAAADKIPNVVCMKEFDGAGHTAAFNATECLEYFKKTFLEEV